MNSGRWKVADKFPLPEISCLDSHISTGSHTGRLQGGQSPKDEHIHER